MALSFAPFIDFEILSFLPLRRPFKFGDLNFLRGFVSFVEIPLTGAPFNPLNPPILLRLYPFVGSLVLLKPLTGKSRKWNTYLINIFWESKSIIFF